MSEKKEVGDEREEGSDERGRECEEHRGVKQQKCAQNNTTQCKHTNTYTIPALESLCWCVSEFPSFLACSRLGLTGEDIN